MIDKRQVPDILLSGMDDNSANYWFDKKCKKFLHNVDTFYYSIKLKDDFTRSSSSSVVADFRDYFNHMSNGSTITVGDTEFILMPGVFSRFYDVHLQVPELYDVFISSYTPENGSGDNASFTSEVIVQLRSYYLWMKGTHGAFDESYAQVKALLDYFNLKVSFVQENRVDYCWHTNYLQNPEAFLDPSKDGNLARMTHTRLNSDGIKANFCWDTENSIKVSYLGFGKRGDKFFVRIYDKVREVLEMGYKPWFFQLWLFHGLINRYDLYCLEDVIKSAAKRTRYRKLDVARLKWFIEEMHMTPDPEDDLLIRKIVIGQYANREEIKKLADKYTPAITRIFNFEFQCMRKASKSFVIFPGAGGQFEECERVYDILDNHDLIAKYLTDHVFSLKDPDSSVRKKDRDYCAFWKALRATKFVDCKLHPKHLKLVRKYTSQQNIEVIKKRVINSLATFSLYQNGDNDRNLYEDAAELLCTLNDNDLYHVYQYKRHRSRLLNSDNIVPYDAKLRNDIVICSDSSGEIYGATHSDPEADPVPVYRDLKDFHAYCKSLHGDIENDSGGDSDG